METETEQAKVPLQNPRMARYKMLLEYLGSHHDIDRIFRIASEFEPEDNCGGWNEPSHYKLALGALLSFLPISAEEYLSILQESCSDDEKERYQRLAQAVKARRLFEGVSVVEIGGVTLDKLLTPLGAKVDCQDAGLSWGIPDRNSLVTLENYKQFFPEQYNFTITNYVFGSFAPQSGVADIHSGLNRASMEGVFAEMFALLWNLTKQGGYSINCYVDTAPISPHALEQIGFEVVHASYEESITQPSETRTHTGEIMKGFTSRGFQKDTDVYDIRNVHNYYEEIGYLCNFDFDSFWKNDRGVNLLVLRKNEPNLSEKWRMFLGQDSESWKVRSLTFDPVQNNYSVVQVPFREYREDPF